MTLNCVGYDHNWVKQYVYDDDAAPLLPKGTIVHLIGFLDTTRPTRTRPTRATGRAAAAGRSPTCSSISATRSSLTEEQFQDEMAKRRQNMKSRNELRHRLPALLGARAAQRPTNTGAQANQQ